MIGNLHLKRGLPLLLLLCTGVLAQAQDAPPTINIARTGSSITVDDDFSDWDDIPVASILDVLKTQNNTGLTLDGTDDLAATYKMTYDENNLYVLVDVVDDTIWAENEAQPWHNDGIELSLLMTDDDAMRTAWSHNSQQPQPGQQKIFYNVGWDTETVAEKSSSAEGDYDDASVITRINGEEDDPTGYTVQFVLPWAAINNDNDSFDPEAAGSRFSLNVAINDNDDTAFPGNPDNDDRREHTLLWIDANMNNQGELFGYVELQGAAAMTFSDDPYFGDLNNYMLFVNPAGANGATVDDWTVMDVDDNPALTLMNGNVNPTHPTGEPFFNPDPDVFSNGQESAPGARAIAADTTFEDFEMMVDMKRPEDDQGQLYDLAVIFGYTDANTFSYANFGIHPTQATATIVRVEEGKGLRTPNDPRFTGMLPVFPNDDDYHQVMLRREDEQVALFIDGEPVMYTSEDNFDEEGSIGVGSWNDGGIYDNITVTALDGDYESKMSFIVSSDMGMLTFDGLTEVDASTTAGNLMAALTLSEGATAMIQDTDDNDLADDATVTDDAKIVVTAEAGNTKTYAITTGAGTVNDSLKIDAVFAPATINEDSTEISILQGSDVAFLLDRVRAPEGATEQVVDADGAVVADQSTELTEEMEYQLVGEDGATRNYAINLLAPDYPTANIATYDDIVMDGLYEEWSSVEPRFEINGISKNENLADTMPSADDISGYYKVTYDDTYLYLYFNITDDEISTSAEDAFRNDGLEIALVMGSSTAARSNYNLFFNQANQPGNQKFIYTFGADWTRTFENSNLAPFNKSSTLFAGAVVEGFEKTNAPGYEVEMQIPWSGLNKNDTETSDEAVTPELGESFSINVSINDNDGGEDRQSVLYWASPQLNNRATDFGIFTFAEEPSSVRATLANFQLDVFPNPVNDRLQVVTDQNIERISVFNINGQLLRQTTRKTVDVSDLEGGAYLLRILTDDNRLKVARFIKQ